MRVSELLGILEDVDIDSEVVLKNPDCWCCNNEVGYVSVLFAETIVNGDKFILWRD